MEKMDSNSLNISKLNLDKIKSIFPEAIVDGKIDFDRLRLLLGDDLDSSEERYSFNWNGKTNAIKISQTPTTGTLLPCKEKSVNWDETKNLYIEGDNLEVLKSLLKTYYGQVNIIYIDPPYNTGKDFVYHDDFRDNISNYLEQTKQSSRYNPETSGRYHTDWLNMIYPRLKIASELLSQDGIIFISIDDNEYANLKTLCDEIFGIDNLLSVHHVQVRYANKSLNEKKAFQECIEYVLIYAKNINKFEANQPYEEYSLEPFCYEIQEIGEPTIEEIGGKKVSIFKAGTYKIIKHKEGRVGLLKGTWASGSVVKGNASGKFFETYLKPRRDIDGLSTLYKVDGIGEDGIGYRYFTGPNKADATQGLFYSGVPLVRLEEMEQGLSRKYMPISNFYDFSPDFGNIRLEGGIAFNSGKKPIKMLKQFINYHKNKNALVMDFFSGSASTAHAVLSLNAEDGGNRKFIMVQLPELCEENSDPYKLGFKNICELGEERIRRSGSKIYEELVHKKDNAGLFSDNVIDPSSFDYGFRVFKLDTTCIKPWDGTRILDTISLYNLDSTIKEERTEMDVVYEIMLKYGVFNMPVKEVTISNKKMYDIANNHMIICLDKEISEEDITNIAKLKPKCVVFREDGFKDDNAKINATYTLERFGIDKIMCI